VKAQPEKNGDIIFVTSQKATEEYADSTANGRGKPAKATHNARNMAILRRIWQVPGIEMRIGLAEAGRYKI